MPGAASSQPFKRPRLTQEIDKLAWLHIQGKRLLAARSTNKDAWFVKMTCYRADFRGNITASAEIAEVIWIGYEDKAKCSAVTKIIMEWLHKQAMI